MPRTPPYSLEAEVGVLGSALIDAERVLDMCTQQKVTSESFYVGNHRSIFTSLTDLMHKGRPVDSISVTQNLKERGELERIGGPEAIEELIDAVPTPGNAGYYIAVVRDKHLLRSLIDKANETIEECYGPDVEAELMIGRTEERFFEVSQNRGGEIRSYSELIDETWKEINLVLDGKKSGAGLKTGYTQLDTTLLGFRESEMIVLAARPSMGKTALALNLMERIATKQNPKDEVHPVAIFSLEMSAEALTRRMLCTRARVSSHELGHGICSHEDHAALMSAADVLREAPIYIDDSAGLSPPEMRSRARRMQKKYGIKFIVVDYLQMMQWPEQGRNGRQNEVAAISSAMKQMAKELKVPVLVLSQLSRRPEDRTGAAPKLSDLRDSGAIEQDADVVMMLRRPSRYKDDEQSDDQRLAIVDVAKNRNGPVGEVHLNFEDRYTRFENRDEGHHGDVPVSEPDYDDDVFPDE
jgi:replicative DNA helicase